MHQVININIPMCFPWSIKLKKISSLYLLLMWFKSYSRNPFQAAAILDVAAILTPRVTCSFQYDLSFITLLDEFARKCALGPQLSTTYAASSPTISAFVANYCSKSSLACNPEWSRKVETADRFLNPRLNFYCCCLIIVLFFKSLSISN